ERAICKPSFKALWTQLLPPIRSCRPRADLCWQCQQNNDQLIRSANLPEERKTAAIKKQQDHLQLVQKERDVYNETNKTNFMLWYGAWRVAHKLPSTLNIHFLIAGHTKFAPDGGFGLIKQAYKRTRVSTLADITKVVENSSPESRLNIPQLVGLEDGNL
ncbi:hypothetical protein ILYODFUR_035009, partial [Ilyodon furcidens]